MRMRLVTLAAVVAATVGVGGSFAGVVAVASGAGHAATGTHVEAGRSNTGTGGGRGH